MWGLLGLLLGGGGAPEVGDGGGGPAAPHRRSRMEAVGRWRRGEGPSRRGSASGKQRVEGEEWRAVAHRQCVRVWGRSRARRRTPALHEARAAPPAKFVKVAVDGAPYLRKVNLQDYAGYDQLIRALQDMFCSHFTIRRFGNDETKLVDAVNGTEYMPTYEDKDGDWMLVGDVPWK